MLRIAILDDNPRHLRRTEQMITAWSESRSTGVMLSMFATRDEFNERCDMRGAYDAYFMETVLGGRDSLSEAATVRIRDPEADIVFITGNGDSALASFKMHPLDYLLKPPTQQQMDFCMDAIYHRYMQRERVTLRVTLNKRPARLDCRDILYIQSHLHTIIIATCREQHCVKMTMVDARANLPAYFVPCSRSCLINIFHVRHIDGSGVVMRDGAVLIPSCACQRPIAEAYAHYRQGVGV